MKKLILLFTALLAFSAPAADTAWVHDTYKSGDFKLVQGAQLAPLFVAPEDAEVVRTVTKLFSEDVERVTGHKPAIITEAAKISGPTVLIGTLGQNPAIDKLVADGKLDAKSIKGQWESFLITTVDGSLVITGSDRRGTAYGVFEVSRAMGVSPWYWWADVAPDHHDNVFVSADTHKFGPPSVKYRGIFINDEDWGLNPWASKTFEPEANNLAQKFAPLVHPPASAAEAAAESKINVIGPKTYAKVFELLLRLKANTLWPAMHEVSTPFNLVPGNAKMADDYGIVMGSSHAEPMLRDNVNEWPHDDQPAYNYVTNPEGVTKYWEERVQANGKYESMYTIGMRGIHDSAIQVPRGTNIVPVLEQIFSVQRGLLAKYVNPDPSKVPQIFCPYKEVLDLFLHDLQVPPDVTVVFPDDNFGYIRYFPTPEQIAARPGGFGIYYHISYLGAPYSYVWLDSTPPALIWEEMSKAYDHDIKNLWILNVGDIKPGEVGIDFFMQMAWDINQWNPKTLPNYLPTWAAEQFGPAHAHEIGDIMADYYRLGYQRKPEHLQWNVGRGEPARPSDFSKVDYGNSTAAVPSSSETGERLNQYAQLIQKTAAVAKQLPASKQDGFFELVQYPVSASGQANEGFFFGEVGSLSQSWGYSGAGRDVTAVFSAAKQSILDETAHYNEQIGGGKWKGIMPADVLQNDRSYRDAALKLPADLASATPSGAPGIGVIVEGRAAPLANGETAALPLSDPFTKNNQLRSIAIFDTGETHQAWQATTSADWIHFDTQNIAKVTDPKPIYNRYWVSIDWVKAPKGADVSGNIVITDGKSTYTVKVPVYNPAEVRPAQLAGQFVESDGVVSILAQHFSKKTDKPAAAWQVVPGLGRTGDAVGVFPTTTPSVELDKVATDAPVLAYNFYLFRAGDVTIHYSLIPTQPIKYGTGLRFAVSVDDAPPQLVTITAGTGTEVGSSATWQHNVLDNSTTTTTKQTIATAGAHTLKIYMVDSGVLFEKIVIDNGGLRPSYLGPPETLVSAK